MIKFKGTGEMPTVNFIAGADMLGRWRNEHVKNSKRNRTTKQSSWTFVNKDQGTNRRNGFGRG